MDMFSLKGKTVVVTGGGRGIGRGITRAMAKAGANVVIAGRSLEPLYAAEKEAQAMGAATLVVPTDITSANDIAKLVSESLGKFGYIDCWVNNAGSADPKDVGRLLDLNEGQFDRVVGLNFKWTFFAAQAAARAMTRGGSIIFITSRSGSIPNPMTGQYGASKAAVENLIGTMAVEWGHLNIRVNGVAPGVVTTSDDGHSPSMSKTSRIKRQIATVPLRRLGRIDDVGPLCVYFASDESSWVSGSVVQVTGGSRISIGTLSYLHHINEMMDKQEAGRG
jgi:NAD(P)-dependent dehydrogenase (short-subunit alcohol dehydrogenase family)